MKGRILFVFCTEESREKFNFNLNCTLYCRCRDHIQVSQETADLLIEAGKEKWVKPRDKKILAKGEYAA